MPLISILIPAYNRPKYLKICLNSIISQKGFFQGELEIIIADDSTNNESQKVIQSLFSENDIIYLKNEKNLGMVENWNYLLKVKKGKYFIFLSDDDLFYSDDSLKTLYNNLIKYNLNAIYGLRKVIDGTGQKKYEMNKSDKEKIFILKKHQKFSSNLGGFGGILFKNFQGLKFASEIGLSVDWYFNIGFLDKYGDYGFLQDYTFIYRIHQESLSQINNKLLLESEKKVIKFFSRNYLNYLHNLLKYFIVKKFGKKIGKVFLKLGLFNYFKKYL